MSFLYGAQDDWTAPPRPWLLVVRDMLGLVLAMVCAVTLTFLMWAIVT